MSPSKIMLFRHAEKPDDKAGIAGVTLSGVQNDYELSVRGWQRAGALVGLFSPRAGALVAGLATPGAIFATAANAKNHSLRPQHTVQPLVDKLKLQMDSIVSDGDEPTLVSNAINAKAANVLVCWHHERIHKIADILLGNKTSCPQGWPDNRFDVVWVFDRPSGTGSWAFGQVPQLLLKDDLPDIIKDIDLPDHANKA
jgi:hypothetical protein